MKIRPLSFIVWSPSIQQIPTLYRYTHLMISRLQLNYHYFLGIFHINWPACTCCTYISMHIFLHRLWQMKGCPPPPSIPTLSDMSKEHLKFKFSHLKSQVPLSSVTYPESGIQSADLTSTPPKWSGLSCDMPGCYCRRISLSGNAIQCLTALHQYCLHLVLLPCKWLRLTWKEKRIKWL